jgi:hypothetical protein
VLLVQQSFETGKGACFLGDQLLQVFPTDILIHE